MNQMNAIASPKAPEKAEITVTAGKTSVGGFRQGGLKGTASTQNLLQDSKRSTTPRNQALHMEKSFNNKPVSGINQTPKL